MQETWDTGSIPGSGRYPGGGHGNPIQYSCLENPTDRGKVYSYHPRHFKIAFLGIGQIYLLFSLQFIQKVSWSWESFLSGFCSKRHYRLPVNWILQVALRVQQPSLLLFSHSVVSNSFATPWTVTHQAPLSMGFPSPGDLPDPRIKPASPALAGRLFTTEPPGKPANWLRKSLDLQALNMLRQLHRPISWGGPTVYLSPQ